MTTVLIKGMDVARETPYHKPIFMQVEPLREVMEPLTLEIFKTTLSHIQRRIFKRTILS